MEGLEIGDSEAKTHGLHRFADGWPHVCADLLGQIKTTQSFASCLVVQPLYQL